MRVPTLEVGKIIHAAWGSPYLTTKPAYTGNGSVCATSFASVHHANGGAGIRPDSTANARHGTPIGDTTTDPARSPAAMCSMAMAI